MDNVIDAMSKYAKSHFTPSHGGAIMVSAIVIDGQFQKPNYAREYWS
jgi:hypothetical protein